MLLTKSHYKLIQIRKEKLKLHYLIEIIYVNKNFDYNFNLLSKD